MRGEYQVTNNKIDEHRRNAEELNRDIKELKEMMNKADLKKEKLINKIKNLNRIMDEKSREIARLEQEIYLHKREGQKLEKFKFVLDHKIKEMKREINPCEDKIEELKDKTTQMDKKLKKFNKLNIFLGYRLKELEETRRVLQTEIINNREKLRKNVIYKKEMIDGLTYCVNFIHSPEELKEAVIEKLSHYKKKGEHVDKLPTDIGEEFYNQEGYLINAVKNLEKELKVKQKTRKESNRMLRNQNRTLITEIQKMRTVISRSKEPTRRTRGLANLDNSMMTYSNRMDLSESNYSSPMIKASAYKSPMIKSELTKARIMDSPLISSPNFNLPEEIENRPGSFEQNKEAIKALRDRIESLKKENNELKTIKGIL
jgi:hypothetical protein